VITELATRARARRAAHRRAARRVRGSVAAATRVPTQADLRWRGPC